MNTYDVHRHPVHGYAAVKRGFSWTGLFFMPWWAFVHRMWVHGLAFIVVASFVGGIASSVLRTSNDPVALWLALGVFCAPYIIFAAKANEWRCRALQRCGFERTAEVSAETKDAAIAAVAKSGDTAPQVQPAFDPLTGETHAASTPIDARPAAPTDMETSSGIDPLTGQRLGATESSAIPWIALLLAVLLALFFLGSVR